MGLDCRTASLLSLEATSSNSMQSGSKELHLITPCCGLLQPLPSSLSVTQEKQLSLVRLHMTLKSTYHNYYSDLAVDNASVPQAISIKIKSSKTDQCRRGYKVVLGRTDNCLCPVSALLSYLAIRGNSPGPLFHWQNKTPLSKPKFVEHVRQALLSANLPAHLYAGHSFQIGAATTAVAAGIKDSTIQTLGRWKSSSYLLYIRLNPSHMASLSSTLAQCSI